MKTKFHLLFALFCLIFINSKIKAQVPAPDYLPGCMLKTTSGTTITLRCRNCCEYNAQSGNEETITHKCVTAQDPNCTGTFVAGRCPKCYFIIYHEATSMYPFFHAIIYVPTINKKWIFDPNATSTTHNSNELEGIINFIPLNGNLEGDDMTSADHELLNGINP